MANKFQKNLAALVISGAAMGVANAQNVTRGFADVVIPFGGNGVELSQTRFGVGVGSYNINSSNNVSGTQGKVYVTPSLKLGAEIDYINGNRSAQGVAGLGINSTGLYGTLGAQGGHAQASVNYNLGKGLEGTVGVNSLGVLPEYLNKTTIVTPTPTKPPVKPCPPGTSRQPNGSCQ